jgi:hypothetical protein
MYSAYPSLKFSAAVESWGTGGLKQAPSNRPPNLEGATFDPSYGGKLSASVLHDC